MCECVCSWANVCSLLVKHSWFNHCLNTPKPPKWWYDLWAPTVVSEQGVEGVEGGRLTPPPPSAHCLGGRGGQKCPFWDMDLKPESSQCAYSVPVFSSIHMPFSTHIDPYLIPSTLSALCLLYSAICALLSTHYAIFNLLLPYSSVYLPVCICITTTFIS